MLRDPAPTPVPTQNVLLAQWKFDEMKDLGY